MFGDCRQIRHDDGLFDKSLLEIDVDDLSYPYEVEDKRMRRQCVTGDYW